MAVGLSTMQLAHSANFTNRSDSDSTLPLKIIYVLLFIKIEIFLLVVFIYQNCARLLGKSAKNIFIQAVDRN